MRAGDLPDLLGHVTPQLVGHRVVALDPRLQRHEGDDRLPMTGSGFDTTAASATFMLSTSADSISNVDSRWPAQFITSSIRPRSQK